MLEANYAIVTPAECEPGYRETAFGLMADFAAELKSEADAIAVRYGYFGTGSDAGGLVFTQLYNELEGFEKALGVMATSDSYQSLINSGKAKVISRNIVKLARIPFEEKLNSDAKYLVFTLGEVNPADSNSVIEDMSRVSRVFANNGALTLRFGPLVTGSNAGKFLLGVSYPSMDAIEKTYDALLVDSDYKKLINKVNVTRREIIKLMS